MLYDRPVRELLQECAAALPAPFERREILAWFAKHYPAVQTSTLGVHISGLTEGAQGDGHLSTFPPVLRRVSPGRYEPVRRSAGPAMRTLPPPQPVDAPGPSPAGATEGVVLVGCVKTKLDRAAPAAELYTSPLFSRRRAYALASGKRWFVLSSRWGLVAPDEVVAPYDMYLADQPASYRSAWARFVVEQLRVAAPDCRSIEVHAGNAYVQPLRPELSSRGIALADPVDARSMGETLAWYDARRLEPESFSEAAISADVGAADAALRALIDPLRRLTPAQLIDARRELEAPGLYAWFVDDQGALDLTAGLGQPVVPGLVYAGQAGATRWPNGKQSDNTLRGRLVGMHLNGKAKGSTFRRTLAAALREPLGLEHEDDPRISEWMRAHLQVAYWPTAEPDGLGRVEEVVLGQLDPPLNLKGMGTSGLRSALSGLRRRKS